MTPVQDYLHDWWRFQITVRPRTGSGGLGTTYGEPFTFMGMVSDKRKMVRSASGEEVVSESQVFGPLDTPEIPHGSEVVLPPPFGGPGRSRTTRVLSVSRNTSGGLDTPDHVEVALE